MDQCWSVPASYLYFDPVPGGGWLHTREASRPGGFYFPDSCPEDWVPSDADTCLDFPDCVYELGENIQYAELPQSPDVVRIRIPAPTSVGSSQIVYEVAFVGETEVLE